MLVAAAGLVAAQAGSAQAGQVERPAAGWSQPAQPLCDEHLCVRWTPVGVDAPPALDSDADGYPDQVEATLAAMQLAWTGLVDQLGYRAPLADTRASMDGDDPRLDIYLADLGSQRRFGYCKPDDSRLLSGAGYRSFDVAAYCVLDNDFSTSQFRTGDPESNLAVTAVHEFFHAVQYGYDVYEDDWLLEGTATWLEDELLDDVNANRAFLDDSQLLRNDVPLDTNSGDSPYGSWLFFRYLSERFGPGIVQRIWNYADGSPHADDEVSLHAVGRAMVDVNATLANVYADFALATTRPSTSFDEGADYPVRTDPTARLSRPDLPTVTTRRLDHLTFATQAYEPFGPIASGARLALTLDLPRRSYGARARVMVERLDGSTTRVPVRLDAYGDARTVVGFDKSTVRRVLVVMVNGSDRIDLSTCWSAATDYTCQGRPLDDGRRYSVAAAIL